MRIGECYALGWLFGVISTFTTQGVNIVLRVIIVLAAYLVGYKLNDRLVKDYMKEVEDNERDT